jgi:hypothetical protein
MEVVKLLNKSMHRPDGIWHEIDQFEYEEHKQDVENYIVILNEYTRHKTYYKKQNNT